MPRIHRWLILLFSTTFIFACTAPPSEEDQNDSLNQRDVEVDAEEDVAKETDTEPLPQPVLRFLSPANNSLVSNPVTFEIEAHHIATVQIEADQWPLSPEPWDPEESLTLTYNFEGTDEEREIRLLGFNIAGDILAEDLIHITVEEENEEPGPGTPIGTFENTYYYLAPESAHPGDKTDTLYAPDCTNLAVVSSSFANAACIEGTALLDDGRVINYYQSCTCGGPCGYCWSVMDPDQFPWGKGSSNNPLEPLRSWAVDTDVIDHGTILYVEEWDGLQLPSVDDLGGTEHDGCFRADDVGGGITGQHVDIFAGTRAMWQALEPLFPTRTEFVVYADSPRCQDL